MENQNQVQQEIIRAVINARNQGQNVKKLVKILAKEFCLTEFAVRGVIELSATYGMEQVIGKEKRGHTWKPLNHTKELKKIWDKLYELQGEMVRINNRINRASPWPEPQRMAIRKEVKEESPLPVDSDFLEDIERLRSTIDKVRNRLGNRKSIPLEEEEEEERPGLTFSGIEERG